MHSGRCGTCALVVMVMSAAMMSPTLALAQQQPPPPPQQQQDQDDKSIVTDMDRTVWRWQAQAAVTVIDATESEKQRIIDEFVVIRARHKDALDYEKELWREERDRWIRDSRRTGGVGSEIFDESDLQKRLLQVSRREQQRLARSLLGVLRKERAEVIYPYLGGFDSRVDGLVRMCAEFELPDDIMLTATKALLDYGIDDRKAQQDAGRDREKFNRLRTAARDRMLNRLRPLIEDDQHNAIAIRVGARRPGGGG